MYIFRNNESISWDKCVATVGFFDGVHGGHRFLINEVIAEAKDKKLPSVVVTFNEHPRSVLKSDYQPSLLTTLEEKLELLSSTGIDACVVLDFTIELSKYSAKEFIQNILFEKLHIEALFIGYDHRFGHNREEGFEAYQKYGRELNMRVIEADKYELQGDEHFSSTQIRQALLQGDLRLANTLLTYPYTFIGKVVGGYKRGRKIGFPTANIWFENREKIVPAVGVYAVNVYLKGSKHMGMMNIGYRPTFSADDSISMEVHIIDFDNDIYEHTIKIELVYRIRDEKKFDGIDALKEQLNRDKLQVINLLSVK